MIVKRKKIFHKVLSSLVLGIFVLGQILGPSIVEAQVLPAVSLVPSAQSPMLLGLKVHPENPLLFDFIVDRGKSNLSDEDLKSETQKLVKYFLAALTIPDKESWVNLSPTEKDRIIPDVLGKTEMGKTMLEQDYILKQLASSLTNPQTELGKKYWSSVQHSTVMEQNAISKVWIVPAKAQVMESNGIVLVDDKQLKVMMAEDYSDKHLAGQVQSKKLGEDQPFREIILPKITEAVNESPDFVPVRQVYNAVILAAWYKQALKESLLGQVYADRGKVAGVETVDKQMKERVYQQYLETFKKGAYNFIKEEEDLATGEVIPRKYFSGGIEIAQFGKGASSALVRTLVPTQRISQKLNGVSSAAVVTVRGVEARVEQASSGIVKDEFVYLDIATILGLEKVLLLEAENEDDWGFNELALNIFALLLKKSHEQDPPRALENISKEELRQLIHQSRLFRIEEPTAGIIEMLERDVYPRLGLIPEEFDGNVVVLGRSQKDFVRYRLSKNLNGFLNVGLEAVKNEVQKQNDRLKKDKAYTSGLTNKIYAPIAKRIIGNNAVSQSPDFDINLTYFLLHLSDFIAADLFVEQGRLLHDSAKPLLIEEYMFTALKQSLKSEGKFSMDDKFDSILDGVGIKKEKTGEQETVYSIPADLVTDLLNAHVEFYRELADYYHNGRDLLADTSSVKSSSSGVEVDDADKGHLRTLEHLEPQLLGLVLKEAQKISPKVRDVLAQKTVLLVEDSPKIKSIEAAILKAMGFGTIVTASDRDAAFKIIDGNSKIDYIVTDLSLGDENSTRRGNSKLMGGFDVAQYAKQRNIPVVMVTGARPTSAKLESVGLTGLPVFFKGDIAPNPQVLLNDQGNEESIQAYPHFILESFDFEFPFWEKPTAVTKIINRFKKFLGSSSSGIEVPEEPLDPQQASSGVNKAEYGGIDFDQSKLNLQIKRDGKGVPLPLPQQNIEQINIEGLYPVIINIQPINAQTLPMLLGQNQPVNQVASSVGI